MNFHSCRNKKKAETVFKSEICRSHKKANNDRVNDAGLKTYMLRAPVGRQDFLKNQKYCIILKKYIF